MYDILSVAKNKPNVVDVKGGVIRKVPDEPMESEEEQAAKRMKLTNNEYTAECTSDVLDQVNFQLFLKVL